MKKIIKLLSSNFFISLIVTLIIIYFLPQIFDKYNVALITEKKYYNNEKIYYCDLDNDGKSEKIRLSYRSNPFAIIYNNDNGIIMQWNLSGNWVESADIMFGDYDNNGFNEIYAFTEYEDSVFINSLELIAEDSSIHQTKYIAITPKYNNKQDLCFSKGKLVDLNDDNYKEVIFAINAGFRLQPRNIFAYDIFKDTVYKSPKSGAMFYGLIFYDLNNDGKEEIMVNSWATGNFPFDFPYLDHSAWLMVFNNKLNFIFEPVEFENFTSTINPMPYKVNDKTYIAVQYKYSGTLDKSPALYLYNINGQKIKKRNFDKDFSIITLNSEKRDKLYIYNNSIIEQLDENLKTIKKFNFNHDLPIQTIDADNDNEEELLFWAEKQQKIVITRADFSHPVVFDTPNNGGGFISTIKLNGKKEQHLSIQIGGNWFLFGYTPNPLYYLKYLTYLGIYIGILLFIYLVQKINAYRLEKENKRLEQIVKLRTEEINQQKEKITTQRDEIAIKNKKITDSINYAVPIQNAILPQEDYLKELFGEYFVLFKPKDIVSGDFYWATKIKKWLIVAAVDCTGHGVPGAFMSMLGAAYLNEIVHKGEITQSNQALNKLHEYIVNSLQQKSIEGEVISSTRDGMDIALIAIDETTNNLQFSGANNSLYLIFNDRILNDRIDELKKYSLIHSSNHSLIEIKGDKLPIGFSDKKENFTFHEIQLQKGDTLYLFSDGYNDQFGGEKGKKFKSRYFKKLLLSIQDKSMKEQKEILDKTIKDWKGNFEQVDDILVMGIRVNKYKV